MHELYERKQVKPTLLKQEGWQVVEMWECEFHHFFQRNTMAKTYVDSLKDIVDPLNPRDAFYVGPVNATKLLVKTESTTTNIKYVDFTSLYPDINKNGVYPVGHPLMSAAILDCFNATCWHPEVSTIQCYPSSVIKNCCQGVVTVIEAPDGPQEENDMKDGETGSTHSTQTVDNPVSFAGAKPLVDVAPVKGVKTSTTQNWLESQLVYTLHKLARKRFKRNRVIVNGKDEQWQADLVDVQALKKDNDGYRFLLTVIDLLSKYAWVVPLKDKTGKSLVDAFDTIFKKDGRVPKRLQTVAGKEFLIKEFQRFLTSQDVRHFVTYNETKAQIVERLNRTLKNRMWRYFTYQNSQRYLEAWRTIAVLERHLIVCQRPMLKRFGIDFMGRTF